MPTLNEQDRRTFLDTLHWFGEAGMAKMTAGSAQHGGVLRHKGGLLAEAEAECLDHVIYLRAIRYQLEGIYDALGRGEAMNAASALRLLLHGDTSDILPGSVVGP